MERRPTFSASEALILVDSSLRIVTWNASATALTGVTEDEAIGSPCYSVFAVKDPAGRPVCRADCPLARRAFAGEAVPPREALVERGGRRRRVMVHLVGVEADGRPLLLHLVSEVRERPGSGVQPAPGATEGTQLLTPRQREILAFLEEGIAVRGIGARLGLSEVTVRNHVRGILVRLGCHSQLEAVAKARRLGLV